VLWLCQHPPPRLPYSYIAKELCVSPSEVHAAVKRAQGSHLLHGAALGERPNCSAIEEFMLHGLKYAFPAERGGLTRGVPTSYAAAPLRSMIAQGTEPPPVWPYPSGTERGVAFSPLYRQAPKAALNDPTLYELLALVDALRDGRARERKLAEDLLVSRIRATAHA
jgi:hypothetical protein